MKKIVCKIQDNDDFIVENAAFTVDFSSKEDCHYTLFDQRKRMLYQCINFSDAALDLLYISLIVYCADRRVLRKKQDDGWTRNMKLYIPVLEVEKWNANKNLLERMLSFLSGDKWALEFRKREHNGKELNAYKGLKRSKCKFKPKPKAVCMLSGGLDSFIGAIDLLNREKDVWFVGHHGGGKGVLEFQEKVIQELCSRYELEENHFFSFHAAAVKPSKDTDMEDTTRTRSFMFFAHAIFLAASIDENIKLYIPENGVISLNIPLTNTRLGSCSTRTTHPYYMEMLQELITNVGLKVKLTNPYQFKTKGEMIKECSDVEFIKAHITKTMSCSHPDVGRYKHSSTPCHCGYCLPCVIRRASIEFAYGVDESAYEDLNFESKKGKKNLRSFKLGIRDYDSGKTNPAFAIQISGPITDEIDSYCGVYKRGLDELKHLLDKYEG